MKTLTFILLTAINISAFCQAKVIQTSTIKAKPSSNLASTASTKKTNTPAEKPEKSCSMKEYKMEKQQMYTHTYYKCPKCSYDTTRGGYCPKDGAELKLVIERKPY